MIELNIVKILDKARESHYNQLLISIYEPKKGLAWEGYQR